MQWKRRAIQAAQIGTVLAAALAAGPQAAVAQEWPTEPLTMVIPFSAGGSIDRLGRTLAPALSDALGVDVRVENREGARGQIGFNYVHNAPADGSVFMVAPEPYLSNALVDGNTDYTLEDFAIVAVQEADPISVTVREDSPYQSLGELIQAIREEPDTIRVGVSAGSAPQLQLKVMEGVIGELPYREVTFDGTEYRNALLGGHVDFVMSSASGDLPMKGEARVLAIASDEPFPGWEGVPSINESLEAIGEEASVPYIAAVRYVAFPAEFRDQHPDRWETFREAYEAAVTSESYQSAIRDSGQIVVTRADPLLNAQEIIANSYMAIQSLAEAQ